MTKAEILAAVDTLVDLARHSAKMEHAMDTCGHNQDYLRMQDATAAYLTARMKFEEALGEKDEQQ